MSDVQAGGTASAETTVVPPGPVDGPPGLALGHAGVRTAAILVGLVAVCFVVTQWLLVPRSRPTLWDEAIYLSQVTPGMRGAYFKAWHTRGIVLLVAPVTSLGGSVEAVRTYLTLLSGVATVGAFGTWMRRIGVAAAIAAALFSFAWVSLLSAAQVMPNYWAALLGVAATGMLLRRLEEPRVGRLVWATGLLAAMTFVRPTEGTLLFGGWVVAVLVVRRTAFRDLAWSAVAVALGWLPWVIEMSMRFGGVAGAIREARTGGHFGSVDVARNVLDHIAFAAGKKASDARPGAVWWALVVILAVLGLVRERGWRRAGAVLASAGGTALAAHYLLFVPAFTPRFLLPAYALAAVAAAIGLASLVRGGAFLRVVAAAIGVVVALGIVWQGSVLTEHIPDATYRSTRAARIGTTMRRLADGRPCFFFTARDYPGIALASRCQGSRFRGVPSADDLDRLGRGTRELFVVVIGRHRAADPILGSLTPYRFETPKRLDWLLYHVPPDRSAA
ncbi:MAG TPA: hypothetical protein VFQ40_04165 [Actinomycetota bacterium]|nr:hypothetical protein [Actinomycetota bacterium]